MVRKRGKLPGDTLGYSYGLSGSDTIEIRRTRCSRAAGGGADDLLATGGTMAAAIHLLERRGLVGRGLHHRAELPKGREKLKVPAHRSPLRQLTG